MSKDLLKTIGGIFLAIGLTVLIVFEIRASFNLIYERKLSEVDILSNLAKDKGAASVSIDEIKVYDEVPQPDETGDIILLRNYNIKLKIDGELTDDSMANYGKYTYSCVSDHRATALSIDRKTSNVEDFRSALSAYWYGDVDPLVEMLNSSSTVTYFYQSSSKNGNVPVFYLEEEDTYYMFIDCDDDAYLVLASIRPFALSDKKVTVHYDDPSANPQMHHTYSDYEVWAAEATIKELLDGEDEVNQDNYTGMYQGGNVTGTSATYTSEADSNTRKQMASLGNFVWKKDGTSDETSYTVDITSENAKDSEWVLTDTTYDYTYAGLHIYGLNGSRSNEAFYIEGTIANTLDSERPYVIVIKYLDTEGGLLGLSVIDRREDALDGNDVDLFSMTVSPSRDKIDIQKINSVMFEVY